VDHGDWPQGQLRGREEKTVAGKGRPLK
jgi:hypothetical protein